MIKSLRESDWYIAENQQLKRGEQEDLKSKKRICSGVSANSPVNPWVSPGEEKEGYGGKDLQKGKAWRGNRCDSVESFCRVSQVTACERSWRDTLIWRCTRYVLWFVQL